jgi:hypothetical protein
MSRKRLVMKPITDLWWRYCRTNRENLCTFFWYRNLLFSGKRLSVNLCADSHNSALFYYRTLCLLKNVSKCQFGLTFVN